MSYVELFRESRGFSEDAGSIEQTMKYGIFDDEISTTGLDATYGSFFTPNDDVALVNYIAATFPAFRKFRSIEGFDVVLFLAKYSVEEVQQGYWILTLSYSAEAQSSASSSYVQFGFSTNGDTIHISKSNSVISAVARTGSGFTAPDNKGCIGLTKSSIEGADIKDRKLTFNITGYFSPDIWDTSFLNLFYTLTGKYNNATFYGFAAGEVLFLGAEGQGDAVRVIPIVFNFEAKANLTSVSDAGFPNLTMLGHDLLDYTYMAQTDSDAEVMWPMFRYVHRVYDSGNLTLLGI